MTIEIQTWQIVHGKLNPVKTSLVESNRKEKEDLEQWIKSNPDILGSDIAIIGEQVPTRSGPLDFLGIDNNGNAVIVELKRDLLPREALVQAIDYAADVSDWEVDKFKEICKSFTQQPLEDYLQGVFTDITIEELSINQVQRLLLVGFSIEESLSRMIEWLSDKYNVGINAIILNYIKTNSGDELLSRTVIISEEMEKEKANRKKFIIEMSNEPGSYDDDLLKEKLTKYFSKNLYSSQRIRDYFIPILFERGLVTREQFKKEFVKMNAAPDESQAGYFLALISNQLGHKQNDYLRQIISYDFPNHPWEKDNFNIRDKYTALVKDVLKGVTKK